MSKNRLTMFSFVRRFPLRLIVVLAVFWGEGIVPFSAVSAPFSAVMVEWQVSIRLHGNFRYVTHSDWVDMDQVPPQMGPAVIAAGDQRFPGHWGFDTASIEKALTHSERNENRIHGVSAISQQTTKNLFLRDGRSRVRKGLEARLTLGIETVWSRKRTLTVYLNIAEFGGDVFGAKAAAQRYFHKPAGKLTRSEAALLIAVLPNPLRLKVSSPSGYTRNYQAWILRQMYQLGGKSLIQQRQLN